MVTICSMKLHLVDLYENSSNYSPKLKIGPVPGGHKFYTVYNTENFKYLPALNGLGIPNMAYSFM